MSFLSDIGTGIIKATTGQDLTQLSAEAQAAEQQLQLAIAAMLALEAIVVIELFVLIVVEIKR